MFYRTILLLIAISFSASVWALAPIESLVLGNFSENYSENKTDPLNYVFTRNQSLQSGDQEHKRELALYRGFYEEGKNIQNYCKQNREIHYSTEWEKVQVMRSMLSEIQYIGLDLTSRAIPKYAKALEFSKDEYMNLVDNLIGNFCSNNLSVISKKELRNNLILKYEKENTFKLPSVEGNPLFPDTMRNDLPDKVALEQEFKFSVKLFQSVCSWGGDPNNEALMVPILKHPALMSFFIRQLDNQEIDWKPKDNNVVLKEDKKTVQVWCENLICRKSTSENFYNRVYHSVGGTSVSEDLKRLYCNEWSTLDYKTNAGDERINHMINSMSFDDENFINSQFMALITGVPDFLLRGDKFSKGEDTLRASVDYAWSKWAKSEVEKLDRELYFEEPLTLELVERKLYFKPLSPKYKVSFDVNLGEFDRVSQRLGKVRISFAVNIQKSFLRYYRETLKNLDPRNTTEKERLLKRFKLQMSKDVALAREKLIIPPWKGDLEALIANELTEQILSVPETLFNMEGEGVMGVPIELNYGVFALKYINHQKMVKSAQEINSTNALGK